jgi:hypothetical protein
MVAAKCFFLQLETTWWSLGDFDLGLQGTTLWPLGGLFYFILFLGDHLVATKWF